MVARMKGAKAPDEAAADPSTQMQLDRARKDTNALISMVVFTR